VTASYGGVAPYSINFASYKDDLCKAAGLEPVSTAKQEYATAALFHDAIKDIDVLIDETYHDISATTTTRLDAGKSAILSALGIDEDNTAPALKSGGRDSKHSPPRSYCPPRHRHASRISFIELIGIL